ncbi:unnamed protein product [Candidula unifasciata]|uniref:Sodium-dependent glucose transporter 1 n=1 Tax=Candidula unifasciata TaxID=100452 RepID=A0A8S3Z6Z5_9EUPU|nr:unnamed protein product [Candidula unifasciata]
MNGTKNSSDHLGNDVDQDEVTQLLPPQAVTKGKENILKRCFHDRRHRRKVLHSVWLGLIFISLGMALGQSGPTLLDLQILTNSNLEAASLFLTSSSVGYLAGSILCGFIYDRVNKNLFLLIGVIGLGLLSIAIPFCVNVVAMNLVRTVFGIFIGVVDAGGNAEQMRVWGNEGHELMQMLHFFFAIGGVIAPLYTGPFLAQTSTANTSVANLTNSTDEPTIVPQTPPVTTDVGYAYIITGVFCIVSGIPWLVIYLQDKCGKGSDFIKATGAVTQRKLPLSIMLYLISMICLMYILYVCAEVTFSSYLMTFLVNQYNVGKSTGTNATSVFWAFFAASRFAMIFISQYVTAVQLLFISCVLMIITSICFTIAAVFNAIDGMIVLTAFFGLSVSAVFPAGFSWTESHLMKVTSWVSACILISSSLGGMVIPTLQGYLMENESNLWFCYLLLIEIILMVLVFVILYISARFYINKRYIFINEVSEIETLKPSWDSSKI